MKKLFIVLIAIVSAISVNAQENVKKEKDLAVVVDSLTAKLNKLQNDYDYLYCNYELNKTSQSLTNLSDALSIKINELKFMIYNERFNYNLYKALEEYYDAVVRNYNSIKEGIASLKMNIRITMMTSNFSELQKDILRHTMGSVLDNGMDVVAQSLSLYKSYLEEYYKKW
ncbi:MAG: hypothetical protein II304_15070 [Bacteroidales bacterium]|nr:hypothetical protein [Bacteroidales bacterium]MEE0881821.1 hypothetical protein [Bacteroidales bacterium]